MRKSLLSISITVGVSMLALTACDQLTRNQGETSDSATPSDVSSKKIACIDPKTGELLQPGPDVDCSVPAQASTKEEPVVRDLEGGGKAIDLKGQGNNNSVQPASQNRLAIIDRATGELMTVRPDDAKAAARYDRSLTRARVLMERQSRVEAANDTDILHPEAMANGGIKIDLKGRYQIPLVAKLSKDGQIHLRHQHQH